MLRLEKLEGFGNVKMVEVEKPEPGPGQMLVMSLIQMSEHPSPGMDW